MGYEVNIKVGPQGIGASLGDGSLVDPYAGKQAQIMVQDFGPRYAEVGYRGLAFCGCNQASQAISNLNTTATGLILINPLGSGKNLWVIDIAIAESAAITSVVPAVGLAANVVPVALTSYTLTTPLTIQPTLLGSVSNSVARLCSAATLPSTPVYVRSIWGAIDFGTAPGNGSPNPYVRDEVAGAIGVSPGCSISLSATAAISLISSITWLELPV
jgi:hypothetical protein